MKSHLLASLLFAALAVPAFAAPTAQGFDNETVGAEPKSFAAAVGNWVIVEDAGNKGLSVNGTKWARGQTSAGLADKARALYGERYAEFLDNVQAYAYFPIAVMNEVADFREGTITVRFKGVDGRIELLPQAVRVTAELGFLLSAMSGTVESEIRRVLAEKLG